MNVKDILVVDCQYDFIDGTLACAHAEEAVKNIIAFINANPSARVFYSADNHSPKHCSYIPNGGTWPVHCQAGTHGAELHASFSTDIINPEQRPNASNVYFKGENNDIEEYSAFSAWNEASKKELSEVVGQDVLICGIATEFCVKETVLAFAAAWRNIEVSASLLGWVDEEGHKKTLEELFGLGAEGSKFSTVIIGGSLGDSLVVRCCYGALWSVFHKEDDIKPTQSIIERISESAFGEKWGEGDPSKLLAAAISDAPEREQELRDAFASPGSRPNAPLWTALLKDKGCRVVCMSQYPAVSGVIEFVKPQATGDIEGVVPAKSVFVADDEKACEAAKEAGFYVVCAPNFLPVKRMLSRIFVKVDVHD